jgi:mycoredoxin
MNTDVVIYTRPGCPYCYRLRRGLRRRRVPFGEINIRHDSVAAAEVRTHANGTETVPTVRVGSRWLVNPAAAAVLRSGGASRSTSTNTLGEHRPADGRRYCQRPRPCSYQTHPRADHTWRLGSHTWLIATAATGLALLTAAMV